MQTTPQPRCPLPSRESNPVHPGLRIHRVGIGHRFMNVIAAIWTTHPGDILGEAIDFVTHGAAQHAGFIRGNGQVHELYLPRIRERQVLPEEKKFIRVFEIEGLTDELNAKLERHFDEYLAANIIEYSIPELFRIVLNQPMPNAPAMVCSQYVFTHLKMIGLPPLLRCEADFISPRDLLISPRLTEIQWSDL